MPGLHAQSANTVSYPWSKSPRKLFYNLAREVGI